MARQWWCRDVKKKQAVRSVVIDLNSVKIPTKTFFDHGEVINLFLVSNFLFFAFSGLKFINREDDEDYANKNKKQTTANVLTLI